VKAALMPWSREDKEAANAFAEVARLIYPALRVDTGTTDGVPYLTVWQGDDCPSGFAAYTVMRRVGARDGWEVRSEHHGDKLIAYSPTSASDALAGARRHAIEWFVETARALQQGTELGPLIAARFGVSEAVR
jgi:hypothetical protein